MMSKSVGISFCGGGFLGAFHVGAWDVLARRFPHWSSRASVAGSSAGALVGAAICSGLSTAELRASLARVSDAVTALGPLGALTPGADLSAIASEELARLLPADANERCDGRLHVGVTTLDPRPHFHFVSRFRDRDHLIDCVRASSFLPGVTGPLTRVPVLDGVRSIDGGFARNWPRLPREHRTLYASAFAGPDFEIAPPADGPAVPLMGVRLTAHAGLVGQLRDVVAAPSPGQLAAHIDAGARAGARFIRGDDGQVGTARSSELLALLVAAEEEAEGAGRQRL
jgi:hypothetical protein